ncbi:hypothetical protein [Pseudomonas umsongensis]|jgi:hypothetical protein|uniref:Uncharacterized protein n=1 Tax=Pseudomonas umsongensis TaxID=198618 RepID=A0AAE7DGM8_9PSED|nr:hypothetical protein [Pseudomonas umsongensis]QJC82107.1 hypothetical protein HGP31_28860 [Pseudomonas umsongensis]
MEAERTTLKSEPIDRQRYLELAQPGNFYKYQGMTFEVKEKTFLSLGGDQYEIEVKTTPVK